MPKYVIERDIPGAGKLSPESFKESPKNRAGSSPSSAHGSSG